MISCVLKDVQITPASIVSDNLGILVPDECDEIKAFIWEDNLMPIIPAQILSHTSKIKSEMNIPKLGNAYFGNNVELGVTLKEENNRSFEGKLRLTLEAENGECVISEKDIGLNGREEKNVNFNIAAPKYGYYSVKAECISADGVIKSAATDRISVIAAAKNTNAKVGFSDHTTKNYGFSVDKLKMAANAGAGTIRDEIRWTEFETTEGVYTPDIYTKGWLDFTEETGQKKLSILGYWFPERTQVGIPRTTADIEAFKKYVTEVLKYTKDMNIDYELWNEHNVHMGDDYGSIDDYVNIAKIVYPLKQEINPDAKMYVLATGNTNNVNEYIEECFKKGIGDYCDGISIHPYNITLAPEHTKFNSDINSVKDLMTQYNMANKELIISEMGWTTTSEEYKWTDEDTQANYTIRAMALYQDMVDRIYWYNLQEKTVSDMTDVELHFGFLRGWTNCEIPYEPKPAFLALSNYNRLMTNSQKIKKMEHSNENAEVHLFNNNKGTNTIIAWSKASEVKTAINIGAASVVISDRYGNEKSVDTKNGILELSLTVEPIYITGSFSDEISEYEVQ